MAHKLLSEWRIRAIESGYVQEIRTGSLAVMVKELDGSYRSAAARAEVADFDVPPAVEVEENWPDEAINVTLAVALTETSSSAHSIAMSSVGSAA